MERLKIKRKFKASKAKAFALLVVLIILIVLIFVVINKKNNPLLGKWKNDNGDTIYQFDKDYTGKLIISIGEYNYKYEISGDKVSLDFESEAIEDPVFTFKIEDDNLILTKDDESFTFKKSD